MDVASYLLAAAAVSGPAAPLPASASGNGTAVALSNNLLFTASSPSGFGLVAFVGAFTPGPVVAFVGAFTPGPDVVASLQSQVSLSLAEKTHGSELCFTGSDSYYWCGEEG